MDQHHFDKLSFKNERGVMTLISVLLVGAIGASISILLLTRGIEATKMALSIQESAGANAYAHACAEYALRKLQESESYGGNETVSFSTGTCRVDLITGTGDNRTIKTVGFFNTMTRKVAVEVNALTPNVGIASWREVAD
ncbi:MAG: hypothetical protein Q7R79_02960 [bacterium]|nr:hypothetical protein [bacterium]